MSTYSGGDLDLTRLFRSATNAERLQMSKEQIDQQKRLAEREEWNRNVELRKQAKKARKA